MPERGRREEGQKEGGMQGKDVRHILYRQRMQGRPFMMQTARLCDWLDFLPGEKARIVKKGPKWLAMH